MTTFANGETTAATASRFAAQTCSSFKRVRSGRPEPHGAAPHDSGGEARLGEADHRRDPPGSPLAAGSEGEAARADLGPFGLRTCSNSRALTACGRWIWLQDSAGFFTIPVDHMTALPLFAQHFRDLGLTGEKVVSVAPDAGRARYAIRFAEMISADFAIMHKTRPAHDEVAITEVIGGVRDRIAIVGDDVTTTGSTQIAGASTLREHGATEVWMFVTHSLLGAEALQRLAAAEITGIVVTDTVPIDPTHRPPNMTVLTVSGLLAETIMNVFADDSVSAIFGGENQLF